jgi:hypothetical protein
MSKTQFRLGVGAIFAAILLFNLTSPNRYTVIGPVPLDAFSVPGSYLLDGVTGKMYRYSSNGISSEPLQKITTPTNHFKPNE